jgi:hypothetical protein
MFSSVGDSKRSAPEKAAAILRAKKKEYLAIKVLPSLIFKGKMPKKAKITQIKVIIMAASVLSIEIRPANPMPANPKIKAKDVILMK